jgi:alpha-beta hydrolase superfamily lysophospholipase
MYPIISTPALAKEAFFSADIPESKMQFYFSQLKEESFRVYLDMLGLNLAKPKKNQSPLLVLGAEKDKMISQKEVKATAQAYGVTAELFSAMPHDMMLDDNWKKVAERILLWLDKQLAAS